MSAHLLLTLLKIFPLFRWQPAVCKLREANNRSILSNTLQYMQSRGPPLTPSDDTAQSLGSSNAASTEAACPPKGRSTCTQSASTASSIQTVINAALIQLGLENNHKGCNFLSCFSFLHEQHVFPTLGLDSLLSSFPAVLHGAETAFHFDPSVISLWTGSTISTWLWHVFPGHICFRFKGQLYNQWDFTEGR